jgi:peptidoglycan/xylan/chitin deacetylase (PgdA/CDA1 family)
MVKFRVSFGAWLPVLRRYQGKGVSLSYDDGPNPDSTPLLLEILDAHQAKATFFLSGFRAVDHPDIVSEMVRRGHQIYAHGWEHVRLDRLGAEGMIEAMERTERLLRRWRPTPQPYLVRLPYHGGLRKGRVHRALRRWRPDAQYAYTSISWRDHQIHGLCKDEKDVEPECHRAVQRLFATEHVASAIVIFHDKPVRVPGDHSAAVTLRLTDMFLTELDRRGLSAVPIAPASHPQPFHSKFILT